MAIFTVTEAREFKYQGQTPLSDADNFPSPLIEAAAVRIGADFARICGVAFEPTTVTDEIFDGPGGDALLLPHVRVTAVTAAGYRGYGETDWTAFTGDELAAVEVDGESGIVYRAGASWPRGHRRLRLTYTHGYAAPPEPIKRAALILAVNQLVTTNSNDRATQVATEHGSYNLSVPGWREQAFYGIPVVDSVLARYSERGPSVGD